MEKQAEYGEREPKKLCPLLDKVCRRERCALWCGDDCAIVLLALQKQGPVAVKNITPTPGI